MQDKMGEPGSSTTTNYESHEAICDFSVKGN